MFGVLRPPIHVLIINTVTFTDDHSPYTWIYFLQVQSTVYDAFKKFSALIENQFSNSLEIVRSNSGEYVWNTFQEFLQNKKESCLKGLVPTPRPRNKIEKLKEKELLSPIKCG